MRAQTVGLCNIGQKSPDRYVRPCLLLQREKTVYGREVINLDRTIFISHIRIQRLFKLRCDMFHRHARRYRKCRYHAVEKIPIAESIPRQLRRHPYRRRTVIAIAPVFVPIVFVVLVCDFDEDDLSNCIETLLDNGELCREFGETGRKLIEDKYDWDKVSKHIESIYRSCF